MTFCYSPWTNIDISPQGEITPCCKFQIQHYNESYNIQTHTLDQYVSSNLLAEVKKEFKKGIWPKGCERCRIEEQNKIQSKRNLDFARWQDHYNKDDIDNASIITASIAFGNTCNLKCITCNSYSSSHWQKEYSSIYSKHFSHVKFYKKDFVQNFVKQAPNILHIDIPGGEPLISGVPEQQELLQFYINTGTAGSISLHYTTNATVFPDQTWWDLWKHFKEIDIQLSIDGVGNKYEYIRFPASWNTLETNVQQYLQKQSDNIRLSVSHTVSAYNIFYLDEFFTWCYSIGLPKPWLGRVHNPVHMRATVWPDKEFIIQHLKQSCHPDIQNWIELLSTHDDSEHFDTFKAKVIEHDNYRGTQFAKVFPELKI